MNEHEIDDVLTKQAPHASTHHGYCLGQALQRAGLVSTTCSTPADAVEDDEQLQTHAARIQTVSAAVHNNKSIQGY